MLSSAGERGCVITNPGVDSRPVDFEARSTHRFLGKLFPDATVHHLSRTVIQLPAVEHASSLFYWSVHHCFSRHLPLALDPAVLWVVVLHEVATAVRLDPASWAHLFTRKPAEKQIVRVRDDRLVYPDPDGVNDWATTLSLFDARLAAFVPDATTLNKMLPSFSTSTRETRIATLVALMDAASPYFDYDVETLCGIPSVRMDGTVEDWTTLVAHAESLERVVPSGEPGADMRLYFSQLLPTLRSLAAARAGTTDPQWWQSFYKLDEGSGGPYIHGWITTFFAFVRQRRRTPGMNFNRAPSNYEMAPKAGHGHLTTANFPAHVSAVDFNWTFGPGHLDVAMCFVAGVLGVDLVDGFVTPRLGFGVLERPSPGRTLSK